MTDLLENLPDGISLLNSPQPVLVIENNAASARVALFGAQVLSYIPRRDGRDRLWLSEKAIWDGSKSIRGGIPICWPWFGNHKDPGLPAHGFVRTRPWQCSSIRHSEQLSELTFTQGDTTGPGFTGVAELSLTVMIGESLTLKLHTSNRGKDDFSYTCALHSYFRVKDIFDTTLLGLSGEYADKLRGFARFDTPSPYRFSAETDRIHLNPVSEVSIQQTDFTNRVMSSGHDSVVVWNPWQENAAALPDMDEEDFRNMLCVETAITQGLTLAPGDEHTLTQTVHQDAARKT